MNKSTFDLRQQLALQLKLRSPNERRGSSILKTASELICLEDFLSRLAGAIGRQSSSNTSLRFDGQSDPDAVLDGFCRNGCSIVSIRVAQERLLILTPLEFLPEINHRILGQPRSQLLTEFGERELAPFGYFLAKLLAEEALFKSKPVYLVSIDSFSDKSEAEARLRHLGANAEREGSSRLVLRCAIDAMAFDLVVFVGSRTLQLLEVGSRDGGVFMNSPRYRFVGLTQLPCRVVLSLSVPSVDTLQNLQSGRLIIFDGERNSLSGEICYCQSKSAHAFQLPIQILSGSKPGLLRLKISSGKTDVQT